MKRNLNVVLAAALSLTAASAAATSEYIGVIKRASGHVVIEREGVQLAPASGMELKAGDRLITGPDGYAQVKLRGSMPLSVSPEANIALDRFLPGEPLAQPAKPGLLERLASLLALHRQPR